MAPTHLPGVRCSLLQCRQFLLCTYMNTVIQDYQPNNTTALIAVVTSKLSNHNKNHTHQADLQRLSIGENSHKHTFASSFLQQCHVASKLYLDVSQELARSKSQTSCRVLHVQNGPSLHLSEVGLLQESAHHAQPQPSGVLTRDPFSFLSFLAYWGAVTVTVMCTLCLPLHARHKLDRDGRFCIVYKHVSVQQHSAVAHLTCT